MYSEKNADRDRTIQDMAEALASLSKQFEEVRKQNAELEASYRRVSHGYVRFLERATESANDLAKLLGTDADVPKADLLPVLQALMQSLNSSLQELREFFVRGGNDSAV